MEDGRRHPPCLRCASASRSSVETRSRCTGDDGRGLVGPGAAATGTSRISVHISSGLFLVRLESLRRRRLVVFLIPGVDPVENLHLHKQPLALATMSSNAGAFLSESVDPDVPLRKRNVSRCGKPPLPRSPPNHRSPARQRQHINAPPGSAPGSSSQDRKTCPLAAREAPAP